MFFERVHGTCSLSIPFFLTSLSLFKCRSLTCSASLPLEFSRSVTLRHSPFFSFTLSSTKKEPVFAYQDGPLTEDPCVFGSNQFLCTCICSGMANPGRDGVHDLIYGNLVFLFLFFLPPFPLVFLDRFYFGLIYYLSLLSVRDIPLGS